jgi:hypothetical protein
MPLDQWWRCSAAETLIESNTSTPVRHLPLLNVELGDDQEVFGQHGTGVAHRGQLLQSGIKFAYLSLCVVPVWRVISPRCRPRAYAS